MHQIINTLIPVFFLVAMIVAPFTEGKEVVLPGSDRNDYITSILRHALTYTPDKDYRVGFYNKNTPKVRVFQYIQQGKHIDVIAAGSTLAREEAMLPIYIPLLKGLHGWRIAFVHNKNQQILSPALNTDFNSLVAGQLHSWSDTKILESNGIKVEKGGDYEGLFLMLEKKRFDYFPRSVIEVFWEFSKHSHFNIEIDKHALIHYPSAYYFHVNKEDIILANDINYGLEQALKDGSFDTIFMKFHSSIIDHVQKDKRFVYRLNNPYLSDKAPLHRKELWFNF
jgi:hypothetical protein